MFTNVFCMKFVFIILINLLSFFSSITSSRSLSAQTVRGLPDKLVILYNQPLKTENINEVLYKIKNGEYTDTIFRGPTTVSKSAWIYIPGEILKTDTTRNYILTGFYDFTDLYKKVGGQWKKQYSGGYYMKLSHLSPAVSRVSFRLFDKPEEIAEAYLVACRRNNDYSPSIMEAQVVSKIEIEQWLRNHNDFKIWFNRVTMFFWGILFLTILNLALRSINSNRKGYLTFMLGNIFIALNFIIVFFVEPSNINFCPFNDPVLAVALADPAIIIGIGTLLLSIKYFYKSIDFTVITKTLPIVSFVFCVVLSIVVFVMKYYYQLFYAANAITYFFLTLLICIIYLIIFFKKKFLTDKSLSSTFIIIFIGSLFFAVFTILGFILSLIFKQNINYIGLTYLLTLPIVIGASIYNVFVLLALNIQDFKELKEGIAIKEKAFELEIDVIQNRLNPHFIFNSLNLIDFFMYRNDLTNAREVLFRFSDLLRKVIDNTGEKLILLKEELKMLDLFLQLECSRKKDLFTYRIEVSEEIDTSKIMIPPLLIQPLVENAIKHGILNKDDEGGEIIVLLSLSEGFLNIEVKDNGIGFKKSTEMKLDLPSDRKHLGLEFTQQRLALLSDQNKMEVKDLSEGEGSSVIIKIYL